MASFISRASASCPTAERSTWSRQGPGYSVSDHTVWARLPRRFFYCRQRALGCKAERLEAGHVQQRPGELQLQQAVVLP